MDTSLYKHSQRVIINLLLRNCLSKSIVVTSIKKQFYLIRHLVVELVHGKSWRLLEICRRRLLRAGGCSSSAWMCVWCCAHFECRAKENSSTEGARGTTAISIVGMVTHSFGVRWDFNAFFIPIRWIFQQVAMDFSYDISAAHHGNNFIRYANELNNPRQQQFRSE